MARIAGLLLVAGLVLFLVKLCLAPLWTWDHFAVWGVKSRRMLEDGVLDLGFLDLGTFRGSEPQYPLGLPFAWCLLSSGALPGDLAFKTCHALFALALVALTRHGLLLASGSRRVANALAAWLAVSPVLWDTIGVGHGDVPLALWAVAALVLVLEAVERGAPTLALAGLAAGFLPWLKQEGLVLALALLAAAALLLLVSPRPEGRQERRRWLALLLPAAVTLAASRWVTNVPRARGINFFAGRWWERGPARLSEMGGEILRLVAGDLVAADWLGIWLAFALACLLVAVALRRRAPGAWRAAILAGLVVAMLGVYVSIYFFTALPPVSHLTGSFFRLLCQLTPLALLAMAALSRGPVSGDAAAGPAAESASARRAAAGSA